MRMGVRFAAARRCGACGAVSFGGSCKLRAWLRPGDLRFGSGLGLAWTNRATVVAGSTQRRSTHSLCQGRASLCATTSASVISSPHPPQACPMGSSVR